MQAIVSQGMQGIREGFYVASNALKEWRNNVDVFQKVALIASSAIQIGMRGSPLPALSQKLVKTLETVNMHDFFSSVLKNPYSLLCSIKAEDINEYEVSSKKESSTPLKPIFAEIKDQGIAFHSVKELQSYLEARGLQFSSPLTEDCIRKKSWLQSLLRVNWWVVDIGCVVSYLKEWNVFDTGRMAASLGQHRVLNWLPKCNLDTCVLGSLFSAFVLQCIEAVVRFRSYHFTELGKRRALWDIVSSGTDAILYGTSLLKQCGIITCGEVVIHSLTIVVKSIGIVCCLRQPKYEFYNVYTH